MEGIKIYEEQGKPEYETRFVILSHDEIESMIKNAAREGAKEGIAAYESQQAKIASERTEKVRNSAKILVQHYRKLKKMKDTSVYDTDTVTDLTLSGIFDYILNECRKEEFEITSTKKNMLITGMLLNHVDRQLENYKNECEKSNIPDVKRRYRIIEMMYLQNIPMKPDEVAEVENIEKTSVYRTLEKAYDDLTALFFGVEGIDVAEYRRKKRMENQSARKK